MCTILNALQSEDLRDSLMQYREEVHVHENLIRESRQYGTKSYDEYEFRDPLDECITRLKPTLNELFVPRAFHDVPGVDRNLIYYCSAMETLAYMINPPERLFGSPDLLCSPEYLTVKREAGMEWEMLNDCLESVKQGETEGFSTVTHPRVFYTLDTEGQTVLKTFASGKTKRATLSGLVAAYFWVLVSDQYKKLASDKDEFLWSQLYGVHRKDGKKPEKFEKSQKPNGAESGTADRLRGLNRDFNKHLTIAFGFKPPGGLWAFKQDREGNTNGKNMAYSLNHHVMWKDKVNSSIDNSGVTFCTETMLEHFRKREFKPSSPEIAD